MSNNSIIPWVKIYDYLAELGSVGTMDEFVDQALKAISRIIPHDANGLFINTDKLGRVLSWKTTSDSEKWLIPFNNYYYQTMPDIEGQDIVTVDWNQYQNKEYTNDFIKPQGLRYTIGIFRLGGRVEEAIAFSVHRTKNSRHFNETEQQICRIIQPHLINLVTLLSKKNRQSNEGYYYAELIRDCKLLSKREAEIAALLYQQFTAPEIATKLLISRRTVEGYIANIYEKLKVRNRRELLIKLTYQK
jgi:DNA-binding CsgD family transcriptional regulator